MVTTINVLSGISSILSSLDGELVAYTGMGDYVNGNGAFRENHVSQVFYGLSTASSLLAGLPDNTVGSALDGAVDDFSTQLAATLQKYDFLAQNYYYPPPVADVTAFYKSANAFYHVYFSQISSGCGMLASFSSNVALVASLFNSIASKSPGVYSMILNTPFLAATTCAVSSTNPPSSSLPSASAASTADLSTCAVVSSVVIEGTVHACKVACSTIEPF